MGVRAWLNRWAQRQLEQERDQLRSELARLKAEITDRGLPLAMTEKQYHRLMRAATAAGPGYVEEITELARQAGLKV